MTQQRVLPADVYDYLEFSALVEGGIGWGTFSAPLAGGGRTCNCIHGHGFMQYGGLAYDESDLVGDSLYAADITYEVNDKAVVQVNRKRGTPLHARVPWSRFAKKLNIVRGD